MKIDKKLTSVNILDNVYKNFKIISIDNPINLQKLVNRSLDLYNKNEEFRKMVNNHNSLTSNDSKF
jgi:hypothetical protein